MATLFVVAMLKLGAWCAFMVKWNLDREEAMRAKLGIDRDALPVARARVVRCG